jgi:catechol 2,3-dioxygenase-like lactoylglutathione lyase family enzyme
MLSEQAVMAFLATSNAAQARAFYTEVLGLALVSDTGFALVFDANGTMLRVQKVEVVAPHRYTALGWLVADIAATIAGLSSRGVTFERYEGLEQDALGVWQSPSGAQVAWFKDPDDNVLSLTQP